MPVIRVRIQLSMQSVTLRKLPVACGSLLRVQPPLDLLHLARSIPRFSAKQTVEWYLPLMHIENIGARIHLPQPLAQACEAFRRCEIRFGNQQGVSDRYLLH